MRAGLCSILTLSLMAPVACTNEVETGRAAFVDLCAGCHGADGSRLTMALGTHPVDLTHLSRNNDGVFPSAAVLARIDSYPQLAQVSREAWAKLDGPVILIQTGEGVVTPSTAPRRAIAAYLASIQR